MKRSLSIEVWFALAGLFLGIAFLFYQSPASRSIADQFPPLPGESGRPVGDEPGRPAAEPPMVLGPSVTINQVPLPTIKAPEADPLLPPTSPQLDAVLALKYYLLSDAQSEAKGLFDALPASSRDLVLRSALYAVWERSESVKGDWFMGSVIDSYTSRDTAKKFGNDPALNIDTIDAGGVPNKVDLEIELATTRIRFVRSLLQSVDAKTKAYWIPYLVIKLRRLHSEENEALIKEMVKEGNAAIAESLKTFEIETDIAQRRAWYQQIFKVVFPLVLSALGFVFAKISQSTLSAIDRWIGARWIGTDKPADKP